MRKTYRYTLMFDNKKWIKDRKMANNDTIRFIAKYTSRDITRIEQHITNNPAEYKRLLEKANENVMLKKKQQTYLRKLKEI